MGSRVEESGRFVGSKGGAGVWQRIICWMPPHDIYIEPFAGRAAVFRHKRPAARSILIDLDPGALDAIDAAVRRDRDGDGRSTLDGGDGIQNAECRMQNAEVTPSPPHPVTPSPPVVERIVGDGVEFLRRFEPPDGQRVLIYADPPYPRESRRDGERDYYRYEWTAEQHREFLELMRKFRLPPEPGVYVQPIKFHGFVLISSYWSELYTGLLHDWADDAFEVSTRGGPAKEWLWANYPQPDRLHDYRFIGDGFADRWRVHKRQRTWARMLRNMPPLERRAMLSRLLTEFAGEMDGEC